MMLLLQGFASLRQPGRSSMDSAMVTASSHHKATINQAGSGASLLLSLIFCLLLPSLPAQAAPVQLRCAYPQVADPAEGLRAAAEPLAFLFTIDREAGTALMQRDDFETEVSLTFYQRHLTLTQLTGNESLNLTVIVFDALDEQDLYRSVHSRHAMIGSLGELRGSQHYGRCEPVFDE